jgi:hypothetical protein
VIGYAKFKMVLVTNKIECFASYYYDRNEQFLNEMAEKEKEAMLNQRKAAVQSENVAEKEEIEEVVEDQALNNDSDESLIEKEIMQNTNDELDEIQLLIRNNFEIFKLDFKSESQGINANYCKNYIWKFNVEKESMYVFCNTDSNINKKSSPDVLTKIILSEVAMLEIFFNKKMKRNINSRGIYNKEFKIYSQRDALATNEFNLTAPIFTKNSIQQNQEERFADSQPLSHKIFKHDTFVGFYILIESLLSDVEMSDQKIDFTNIANINSLEVYYLENISYQWLELISEKLKEIDYEINFRDSSDSEESFVNNNLN